MLWAQTLSGSNHLLHTIAIHMKTVGATTRGEEDGMAAAAKVKRLPCSDDLAATLSTCLDGTGARSAGMWKFRFHIGTLATVDERGWPAARSVVLRECNRDERWLLFHHGTNARRKSAIVGGVQTPSCTFTLRKNGFSCGCASGWKFWTEPP